MGKRFNRKTSNDGYKQASLDSYFRIVKDETSGTSGKAPNKVLKPVKTKCKGKIQEVINLVSDESDDEHKEVMPRDVPTNTMQLSKPTPQKTTYDKPLPRAVLRRQIELSTVTEELNKAIDKVDGIKSIPKKSSCPSLEPNRNDTCHSNFNLSSPRKTHNGKEQCSPTKRKYNLSLRKEVHVEKADTPESPPEQIIISDENVSPEKRPRSASNSKYEMCPSKDIVEQKDSTLLKDKEHNDTTKQLPSKLLEESTVLKPSNQMIELPQVESSFKQGNSSKEIKNCSSKLLYEEECSEKSNRESMNPLESTTLSRSELCDESSSTTFKVNLEDYGLNEEELARSAEEEKDLPTIRVKSITEMIDGKTFSCGDSGVLEEDETRLENLSEDLERMSLFRRIMKYVAGCPNLYCVLYDAEKKQLLKFFKLKEDYQYVCYRLFLRQAKWYNMIQLLEDIGVVMLPDDITEMFSILMEGNFIDTDYSKDSLCSLLTNLLKSDVKDIFDSFKLKMRGQSKKQNLITAILNYCNNQSTLTVSKTTDDVLFLRIQDKMGPCVKLRDSFHHTLFRVHLLYCFTNMELMKPFDLYKFMTAIQTREQVLPTYTTDFTPIFESTEEFSRFSCVAELYYEYLIAKEKKDKDLMEKITLLVLKEFKEILSANYNDVETKKNFLKKFTAGNICVKVLSIACSDFRTHPSVREWLQVLLKQNQYSPKKRGLWYEQLACLMSRENIDMCAQIIVEALTDPYVVSPVERQILSERGASLLNRKTNKPSEECSTLLKSLVLTRPDADPFPTAAVDALPAPQIHTVGKKMYVERQPSGSQHYIGVEQVALNYYARSGYPSGIHCEGELIKTIFFLLFWNIIFDKYIPGTFISELQYVPLDICSRDFYEQRKNDFDERLKQIESAWEYSEMEAYMDSIYMQHGQKYTHWSPTILQNFASVKEAIRCIGRHILASILRRLILDYRAFRAGMPDLFVWNVNTLKCKFIEVKSEHDKLSMKQKMWLEFLRSVGAQIEVCHVNSIGSRIKKGHAAT